MPMPDFTNPEMVIQACLDDAPTARELLDTLACLGWKVVRHNEIDDLNHRFGIITKHMGRC